MKIRWFGHACFELGPSPTVVTDPHNGRGIGLEPPSTTKADVVLISHDHFDHKDGLTLVSGPSTTVVDKSGSTTVAGVKIWGLPTYHDERRGAERGSNVIYKWEMPEGIKCCHLGDLGHIPDENTIREIGSIDILFAPVGGVYTVDAERAWTIAKKIKPKIFVPMHYKIGALNLPLATVDTILDRAKREGVKIRDLGTNTVEVSKDELPTEMEVWRFKL